MPEIRPFQYDDHDYEIRTAVWNAVQPDQPTTVASLRREDQNFINPDHVFARFLVTHAGSPIGYTEYGHTSWSYRPHKFYIYAAIFPEQRGHGYGGFAFDQTMAALMKHEPKLVECNTSENQVAGTAFLEKRDFKLAARAPMSTLDPSKFDPEPYAPVRARVAAAGIRLASMRELQNEDPDYRRKLYDLEIAICRDLPWYDTQFTPLAYDRWERATIESPDLRLDGYLVALDGLNYIGLSALWGSEATDARLYTGLTGVLPDYRRRGIATALKVAGIKWAQTQLTAAGNPPLIQTENEENNPMFQINVRLGYVEQPAWVTYTRVLADDWEQA